MSKTYSAGIVTAYGAAKRAGYQGTYEDFCRQQAGYAESAAAVEQAKTAAQTAANTATTKAGEATTAATAAQTAKTQTEQAASQALTDIGTARTAAISALQTEGATQTANATAQAQAAAQSATTASTKASEASASATTATTKATEAAASATSAAQSASDAQDVLDSIPADYSDLSANVSQLQADLGDLENLDTTDKSNLVSAINEVAQTGGADAVSLLKEQIYNSYPNVEAETGSIVSISDGAGGIPVKSLVVGIEPVQDLHGYENPWPAGGGKNKCSLPDTTFVQYEEIEINEVPTGTYIFSAVVTSTDTDENECAIVFLDADKNTIVAKSIARSVNGSRTAISSFTASVPIKYVRLYASAGYLSGAGDTATFKDNMLESGTTSTTYAPYSNICPITGWTGAVISHSGADMTNPTIYPVTFPTEAGTVYGGSLDVTNGTLTVDRAVYTFDGTEDFAPESNTQIETFTYFRWYSTTFMNVIPNWASINSAIMTCYPVQNQLTYWHSGGVGKDSVAWTVKNYAGLCIKDSRYSTAEELKTSLIGQTIAYKLATPITYQLTPTEVKTLLGSNNIWADTGDTSLAYRADTKLYVDGICADCNSMLAPVESTYIATRNYTTGELLIVDNTLYKVTANIANGGAITPNSNVTATTLSEVISALA